MTDQDAEFKKILCDIRQYVPYINSNAYLLQCRLWLEKLSSYGTDKGVRNRYLTELSKQIKNNKLLAPFNEAPPKGHLKEELNDPSAYALKSSQEVAALTKDMSSGEPIVMNGSKSKEVLQENDSWSDLSDSALSENRTFKTKSNNTEKEPNLKHQETTINYLSMDWKKTIGGLQLRLSEMIQQNKELNLLSQKLEAELQNEKLKNEEKTNQTIATINKLHQQELSTLQEVHNKSMYRLEKSLKEDYEDKLKQVSNCYSEQISDLRRQNNEAIELKNQECARLTEIIQNQCLRIMNDISTLKNRVSSCTCDKKVHVLKKCVSRMDKMFQKSEKDYQQHIEQLQQELQLKENALQMHLKVQKAELMAQIKTGQKEQFEDILNTLEVKYIKMLEAHEYQNIKIREQDEAKIHFLSELLEKHGITFNDYVE